MSFKYFNPTDLAFGQKLSAAFIALDRLADSASDNLGLYKDQLAILGEDFVKYYRVPIPKNLTDPCRTDEILDVIDNKFLTIKSIEWKNNKLNFEAFVFNTSNNRISHLKGTTDLKEGYAYYEEAKNNKKTDVEVTFNKSEDWTLGNLLFQFKVDTSSGKVNLIGSVSGIEFIPYDWGSVTHIKWGEQLAGANQSYTPKGYQCICIEGQQNHIEVKVNGKRVFGGDGHNCRRYHIMYVNPTMTISGDYDWIKEIVYY